MRKLYKIQSFVLFIGTIFAWTTVYSDLSRFYNQYGSLLRVKNCTIPNPITTPCFYGAFVFLIGFIWSLVLLKTKYEERLPKQRGLNIILFAGTVFAWCNFAFEAIKFYLIKSGPKVSCSGIPTDNILFTPCFYGSVLFLVSFMLSMVIISRSTKKLKENVKQI